MNNSINNIMNNTVGETASEFPHHNFIHLNHAGIAPWPRRTVRALRDFGEENAAYGALHSAAWSQRAAALRTMLATLINAEHSSQIALLKNTSEALSIVAYGIDWRAHDNIVVGMQEFPSNRVVWESLAQSPVRSSTQSLAQAPVKSLAQSPAQLSAQSPVRSSTQLPAQSLAESVEVRIVDLYAHGTPEQALMAACDKHTRLVAVSSIQYATGYKMDLERLGQYCRQQHILFCVDAIQSVGAEAIDVRRSCIDFLAADAHKWLLAPEGIALLYVKEAQLAALKLNQYGWHTLAHADDYDALYCEAQTRQWQLRGDARRLECGSLNNLGICALHASLSLLMEVGLETVYRRVRSNANYLAENLDPARFTLLTPVDAARRGGIITFKARKADTQRLFKNLRAHKIFCAYRGGGIRLSPHFYTAREDLDTVLELLHNDLLHHDSLRQSNKIFDKSAN